MPKGIPKIKRRRHIFRLGGFGGGQTINIAVPWVAAKTSIEIRRTRKDVLDGKTGIAVACADAVCATRDLTSKGGKVYMAEFTERYAYIVDRLDAQGKPTRCVKYAHDDGDWIKKFDTPGGKKRLLASGEVERVVTLRPPPPTTSQAGSGAPRGRDEHRGTRTRKKHIAHGAGKRAIEAGWVVPVT